jgi:predicted nucleic acid-binding protein
MFDTNIFNSIVDGEVDLTLLDGKAYYATHIQHDEIQATKDITRRAELESIFTFIIQLPTQSFVLELSRLNQARLSNGVLFKAMKERLDRLNNKKQNNSQDVHIAETAIENRLTLVTHDRDLYLVATEFNGAACNLNYVLLVE